MQANRKKRGPRAVAMTTMLMAGAVMMVLALPERAEAHSRHGFHAHRGAPPQVSGSVIVGKGDFTIRIGVNERPRIHPPRPRPSGHYETHVEKVLVQPGYTQRVWVPPVYETCYDRWGRPTRRLVRPGHYQTVHHPPVYEYREVRVWVPHRR